MFKITEHEGDLKMTKMKRKQKQTKAENEALLQEDDCSDITLYDELEEVKETSFDRETYDYDFDVEDDYSKDEVIIPATQLNDCISFDSIKLLLPLTEAEYVEFEVERNYFFRSQTPERPTTKNEDMLHLLGVAEKQVGTMVLSEREENYTDKSMEFEYAKMKYPNAKPFFDFCRRLGVGHMYFKNGEFVCQINGKITACKGFIGLINKNNIYRALNELKGNLVKFDNDKFIEKAQVLVTHVTTDINVFDVNSYIKAFSSYLPIRTDKFSVLKYGNSGYEILARGKQSKNSVNNSFCIYAKGGEIKYRKQRSYQNAIEQSGLNLAAKTLRLELKLYNYKAIRVYLAPEKNDSTISLKELLECKQTPIIQKLKELEITQDALIKARGEYISMLEDKRPTLAVLQRMHGVIHLLKLNDYSMDKVRSYLTVETGKEVRSDELKKDREILQRYIACYKPRTVALLTQLVEVLSY